MAFTRFFIRNASRSWRKLCGLWAIGSPRVAAGLSMAQAMKLNRRFWIIAVFFANWAVAIAVELAATSFLNQRAWDVVHGVAAEFVFLLGVCLQVVFQGPTRLEIMERMSSRSKGRSPRLDFLYLRFNLDRAVRLSIALVLFPTLMAASPFASLVVWAPNARVIFGAEGVAVGAVVSVLSWSRILLLRRRVSAEQFGTTEGEARQLLTFLSKLYGTSVRCGGPPGRLRDVFEGEAQAELLPAGAGVSA